LATPAKPMSPKAGETSGAWATDGAAIGRTSAATGPLGLTWGAAVAAEAGRAKEATIPPETAMTAEALATGLAVREIAVDRDDAGFRRPGTRWRPELGVDK
jgi:hypothetical protein